MRKSSFCIAESKFGLAIKQNASSERLIILYISCEEIELRIKKCCAKKFNLLVLIFINLINVDECLKYDDAGAYLGRGFREEKKPNPLSFTVHTKKNPNHFSKNFWIWPCDDGVSAVNQGDIYAL